MNSESNAFYEQAAHLLKALAHPVRMQIIQMLASGSLTVSAIQANLNTDQSIISHHLIKMRDLGIIAARREGTYVYYSLADPTFIQLVNTLLDSPLLLSLKRTNS